MRLLALIADGNSYLEVHGNILKFGEAEFRLKLAREIEWVEQAKKAVAAGSQLFVHLIAEKNPRVREMSIFLLGLTWSATRARHDISAVEIIEWIYGIDT